MLRDLKYAFYLASSWLWCIGAFFPIILVKDYGVKILPAFVLVNIGGAAWFGMHFASRHDARRLRDRDNWPLLFSVLTIAFQLWFVAWLAAATHQSWLIVAMMFLTAAFVIRGERLPAISVAIFVLSLALYWAYAGSTLDSSAMETSQAWRHALLPLALGFALSPYLDLTFYRAYEETAYPRLVFGLGFGVLFLVLLLFAIAYQDSLRAVVLEGEVLSLALYPVIGFIVIQAAFTAAAHTNELRRVVSGRRVGWLLAPLSIAVPPSVAAYLWPQAQVAWMDRSLGELIYLIFLFSYGLLFPLAVLLRRSPRWLIGILVAATPFYAVGFLLGGSAAPALSLAMLTVVVGLAMLFASRRFQWRLS